MDRSAYTSFSSSTSSSHASHTRSMARTNYTGIVPENPSTNDSHDVSGADPRSSMLTYASTNASHEAIAQISDHLEPPERKKIYRPDAVTSTPPDFALLFPSTRDFRIQHDASTDDGNMNLRVDTIITTTKGCRLKMSLFHLRMTDLGERRFSLRRYCRNSGREICHSARKYTKTAPSQHAPRPCMTNSLSSALHSIGKKAVATPHLDDSGYESDADDADIEQDLRNFTALAEVEATIPTNAIRLEFSNYAQVEVHRCATRSGKGHLFEYWGTPYHWQRDHTLHGAYHLIDLASDKPIAEIVPEPLSGREMLEERLQGSWVGPCSLRITDQRITNASKTDLGDVIVATGLVSMVDDCIKQHWPKSLPHRSQRIVTSDQISQKSHGYTETRR